MPFWDNGIYAHYAIPGWDGMACVFRLDGRYAVLQEPIGVLRGTTRAVRESKTEEWLRRPGGVWRNGWYEDGSGQRWSSDMMTTEVGNEYDIESRQFDTLTSQEIDCVTEPVPRQCLDYPSIERWGTQSKSWNEFLRFNQVFISNGSHFGHFMFEGTTRQVVENKYPLEMSISNVSVFVLLFRWFVSMALMANSYRRGVATWHAPGIGCLSNSRTFNILPIVLLPRLKMTIAAFWTVGCEFHGSQRALGDAWFTMYPAIVEFMLLFYSLANIFAKIRHRRVDDVLFGPTVILLALFHRYRFALAISVWRNVDGRIPTVSTSDEFEALSLFDVFKPDVAIRMHGNIMAIYYIKIGLLAYNLMPLLLSENMTRSKNTFQSYPAFEVEKTLALRASNIGGLGISPVYLTLSPSTASDAGPRVISSPRTGQHEVNSVRVGTVHSKSSVQPLTTAVTAFQDKDIDECDSIIPPVDQDQRVFQTRSPISTIPDHVLVGLELDWLGYLVFGGKYLITYDDWYILTSLAPLRIAETLWNHRISVYEVSASAEGYHSVSKTPRLCRLDDEELCSISFYDVTVCSFC